MATSPNSNNYLVGGERLYVKVAGATNFLDLGNVVNPSMSSNVTKLAHYTARSGMNRKDREEVTQMELTVNFQLDEFSDENLNLFFLGGGVTAMTAQASTAVTGESVTTVLGKMVRLANRLITPGSVTITGSV